MSPATLGSLAARWMAATASRRTRGRPPLAIIASGSKPLVSWGSACKSSSSTTPSGTPWCRAVSTRRARLRRSSAPGMPDRKANMFRGYRRPCHDLLVTTFALIHGAGDVGWCWHLVEDELRAQGHQTAAPDLPADDDSAHLGDYADTV